MITMIQKGKFLGIICSGLLFALCAFVGRGENFGSVARQDACMAFTYDAAGNRIARAIHHFAIENDSTAIDLGDISVAPTITTGTVTVSTTADLSNTCLNYVMSNMTGNCVDVGVISEQSTQLDLPSANGVYILNVSSQTNSKSFKIVKK